MKKALELRFGGQPRKPKNFVGSDMELNVAIKPITDESYTEIKYIQEINKIKNPLIDDEVLEDDTKSKKTKFAKIFSEFHGSANGYDINDDFIDDSEAFEEFIPDEYNTKIGGFYINSCKLNYVKSDVLAKTDKNTKNSTSAVKNKNSIKSNPQTPTKPITVTDPSPPATEPQKTNSRVLLKKTTLSIEIPNTVALTINELIDNKYEFKTPNPKEPTDPRILKITRFILSKSTLIRNNILTYFSSKLSIPRKDINNFFKSAERKSLMMDLSEQLDTLKSEFIEFSRNKSHLTIEESHDFLEKNKDRICNIIELLSLKNKSIYTKAKFDYATVKTFILNQILPCLGLNFNQQILLEFCKNNTSFGTLTAPETQQEPSTQVETNCMTNAPVSEPPQPKQPPTLHKRQLSFDTQTSPSKNGHSLPHTPSLTPLKSSIPNLQPSSNAFQSTQILSNNSILQRQIYQPNRSSQNIKNIPENVHIPEIFSNLRFQNFPPQFPTQFNYPEPPNIQTYPQNIQLPFFEAIRYHSPLNVQTHFNSQPTPLPTNINGKSTLEHNYKSQPTVNPKEINKN